MKRKILFLILALLPLFLNAQSYEPKKVPSIPLNLQGLVQDIHKELLLIKAPLAVGDREYFSLDSRDSDMFEFMAYRNIGKSGERSVRFIMMDEKAYYARQIDAETGRIAQGVLYNDMKDRWEQYLKAKERSKK